MKRILFAALALLPALALGAPPTVTITGRVLDPGGGAPRKATLTCKLSVPASALDGTLVANEVTVTLGADGSLPAGFGLVPNDILVPTATKYLCTISAILANGQPVQNVVQKQLASTPNPIAFGSIPNPQYALNSLLPMTAPPEFSPVSGSTIYAGDSVTVTGPAGSVSACTTDGSTPTLASTPYSRPIVATAEGALTVKCLSSAPSKTPSQVASATYTVRSAASRNAVLYALSPLTPDGCYANGNTTLARDANGNGVAMTFARASVAYFPDTPANGWWRSCPANQLRVSGQWTGAILDANGTNLFATPTDSPTGTAPWSLIAAGPTLTANNPTYPFLDGTSTGTTITESAGVVTGIQQTVTATNGQFCQHAIFQSGPVRNCWGYSLDGVTTHAKFDIFNGSVTYTGAGVTAGIEHLGNGFTRPWACVALTAGSVTPQFFATAACTDNTKAATGATAVTQVIARPMFQGAIGNTPPQPTTYSPAGTARPLDELSWPVSLANGNVCVSIKYEPYGGSAAARSSSGLVSLYGAITTWQAPNSAVIYYTPTQVTWAVTDNAGATRTVVGNIPVGLGPHTYKGCTSTAGAMTLYVDGATMSNATGSGTGILTTPPTAVYVGTHAGSGSFLRTATGAYSDLAVCNVSDPLLCSDGARPAPATFLCVGDSITAGMGISGVTMPWCGVASNLSGTQVAQIARGSWQSSHALAAYQANRGHRWKKVAVLIGSNDLSGSGQAFDTIRQIYAAIIADGAIPVPMTILPRGANEAIRQDMNKAILNWCQVTGYTCANIAPAMEDPSNPGHLLPAYFNVGDETHPNQTGHNAMGAFMAPFLQ